MDDSAALGGDGTSWASAFNVLHDALEVAAPGDEVWVAVGVYRPSRLQPNGIGDGSARSYAFQLPDQVGVYGGFLGTEALRSDRPSDENGLPILAQATVLDGANYFYALVGIGADVNFQAFQDVVLDGFLVSNGLSDVPGFFAGPGAIFIWGESPQPGTKTTATIRNCVFASNTALDAGAMYVENAIVTVENCTFRENTATGAAVFGGATLAGSESEVTFLNCLFQQNSAPSGSGGAVALGAGSSAVFSSCLFESNTAESGGAFYQAGGGAVSLHQNSIYRFNEQVGAGSSGGAAITDASVTTYVNCLFHDNSASNGGALAVVNGSITLVNCTLANNSCADGLSSGIDNGTGATTTVINTILWGNRSDIGGTIAENQIWDAGGATGRAVSFSDLEGGVHAGTGNISDDPLFIDDGAGDFRPLIGPGTPGTPATDAIDSADLTSYTSIFGANPVREDDVYGGARQTEYSTLGSADLDMGAAESLFFDCNNNGVTDLCDISCSAYGGGTCDAHGECGTGSDCDADDALDECQICGTGDCLMANAACADCNGKNGLDTCEIAADGSLDGNGDGILDTCVCFVDPGGATTWNTASNWSGGVVPINGANTYNASISGAAVDVSLDTDVTLDSLTLDEATMRVSSASTNDLTVVDAGGIRNFGQLYVANNRTVSVSSTLVVGPNGLYGKDPAAGGTTSASLHAGSVIIQEGSFADLTNGGSLILEDDMSLTVTGDFIMQPQSSDPVGGGAAVAVGVTPPPDSCMSGNSTASIEGDFAMLARSIRFCFAVFGAESGPVMALGGDFINQSVEPSGFDWSAGTLTFNGAESQTLEAAGLDLGESEDGFTNNFAMNEIEVAAGRELILVNDFANMAESIGVCNEALYLRRLILQPGSTVVLANAKLYVDDIVDNGGRIIDGGCGGFRCPLAEPPDNGETVAGLNRFLAVRGNNSGRNTKLRVTMMNLPEPYEGWNNAQLFVGEPHQACENSGHGLETAIGDCGPAVGLAQNWFWAAPLVCDEVQAHVRDWTTLGSYCKGGSNNGGACTGGGDCPGGSCGSDSTVYLYHQGIIPSKLTPGGGSLSFATHYNVQAVDETCAATPESNYSVPTSLVQPAWSDTVLTVGECPNGPPNLSVDLVSDVIAVLNKFSNIPCALIKARADLQPRNLDFKIDIVDVLEGLSAFSGSSYPFPPTTPTACP